MSIHEVVSPSISGGKRVLRIFADKIEFDWNGIVLSVGGPAFEFFEAFDRIEVQQSNTGLTKSVVFVRKKEID